MWKPKPVPGLAAIAFSLTSAVVSAGVSYVITRRNLETKFQAELKTELDDARSYFQQMYSTPVFVAEDETKEEVTAEDQELFHKIMKSDEKNDAPPQDLIGNALSALQEYRTNAPDAEPGDDRTPAPVIVNNIFTNPTPPGEEVLEALMAERDPSKPYIITKDEFYQNEGDFDQIKFTYWEADDILIDDRHEFNPIDDIETVAGEDNLLRFGYGSADIHVLYVRNEGSKMDLHITRSTGRYTDEVMGLDDDEPHLQHSQPRKFRIRDE